MVILAFLLLGAAAVFYWAGASFSHGYYWADRICTTAQQLCDAPWWLLIAAGAVVVIGLFARMMKA